MSSDALIRFEEDNWYDLAEKFVEKYRDKWDEFVMDEFQDNQPEPPDYEPEVE